MILQQHLTSTIQLCYDPLVHICFTIYLMVSPAVFISHLRFMELLCFNWLCKAICMSHLMLTIIFVLKFDFKLGHCL